MPIVDDFHQIAALLGGQIGHRPVVENEQVDLGQATHQAADGVGEASRGEIVEQPRQPGVEHAEALPGRLVAEGTADPPLAGAGRPRDILPKNSPLRF